MELSREALGQVVRAEWVRYCKEIGDSKPSHVAPWEALGEADKEADRRIGQAVAQAVLEGFGMTEILAERERQDEQWGDHVHDEKHDEAQWMMMLTHVLGEAAKRALQVSVFRANGTMQGVMAAQADWRHKLVQLVSVAMTALEMDERVHRRMRPDG